MSKSTLKGLDKNLIMKDLENYQNSWGTLPVIWNYYSEIKNMGKYFAVFTKEEEGFWKKFEERAENPEIPVSERLVMLLAFHPVAFHKSTFEELSKGLLKMSKEYNEFFNNERVNHLETIVKDLKNLDKKYEYIILKGTSVDDFYEYWDEEKDEGIDCLHDLDKETKDGFDIFFFEKGGIVRKGIDEL